MFWRRYATGTSVTGTSVFPTWRAHIRNKPEVVVTPVTPTNLGPRKRATCLSYLAPPQTGLTRLRASIPLCPRVARQGGVRRACPAAPAAFTSYRPATGTGEGAPNPPPAATQGIEWEHSLAQSPPLRRSVCRYSASMLDYLDVPKDGDLRIAYPHGGFWTHKTVPSRDQIHNQKREGF